MDSIILHDKAKSMAENKNSKSTQNGNFVVRGSQSIHIESAECEEPFELFLR